MLLNRQDPRFSCPFLNNLEKNNDKLLKVLLKVNPEELDISS